LKEWGCSTRHYRDFKKKFYEFAKLPPEGKGLIEFTKLGRSLCYWFSKWGEIAFVEKFGMPSDRAINELAGGGKTSKAIALEVIKEWLEPQSKEQIEINIRKNLSYSDTLHIITSGEMVKRKLIQVALRVLFRLRKKKGREYKVKIASIEEFKEK